MSTYCAAGDIHGALEQLYRDVLAFEDVLGVRFDHVLHVGDFGIWPNPERVDRATRRHGGAGDFPEWHGQGREVPRATTFIKGNHEDFGWLDALEGPALPGLHYLPNAVPTSVGGLQVAGVGGCYGPSNFERPAAELGGYNRRHYTRDEIERLSQLDPDLDVLLLHDAPAGIEFVKRYRKSGDERRYESDGAGLRELVEALEPTLCFFGHHHYRIRTEVAGVPCIGLNSVGHPGHLVAFAEDGTIVGEFPQ